MKTLCKCLSVILCLALFTGTFSSAASAYSGIGTYATAEDSEEPALVEADPAENTVTASDDDIVFFGMIDTSDLTRSAFDIFIKMIKTHPEFLILLIPETIIALIEEIGENIFGLFEWPDWKLPMINAA